MTVPPAGPDPARVALRQALARWRILGQGPGEMGPFFGELRRGIGPLRQQVFGESGPDDPRPRLLVTTAVPHRLSAQEGRYAVVEFPAAELAALRAGAPGLLVFDMSTEGPAFAPRFGTALHGALAQCGLPAERAALLIQNACFAADYRAWAAEAGHAPVAVIAANAYAPGMWLRMTQAEPPGDSPYRLGFALEQDGPRRHRYVCLNFILRAARAMLVAWLLERPERGFISFSVPRETPYREDPEEFPRTLRRLSMPEHYEAHLARVTRLLEAGTHFASDADHFARPSQRVYSLPVEEVAQAELFIVTETEISGPNLQRYTEKTFKALVSGLPLIVFGCCHTIAALRALGFDLHEDLVDQGYDAEEDPQRRFAAALGAVERFLARPPGFTQAEMARLRGAAAHNRRVFETTLPRAMVQEPLARLGALCGR